MKLRDHNIENEVKPSIYVAGKQVEAFEVEYLLVKIAAGIGSNKKHSILKNNLFPPSSRGTIKTQDMRSYISKTKNQPNIIRFGDFNLLLFIAEAIELETAMEIGVEVAD